MQLTDHFGVGRYLKFIIWPTKEQNSIWYATLVLILCGRSAARASFNIGKNRFCSVGEMKERHKNSITFYKIIQRW